MEFLIEFISDNIIGGIIICIILVIFLFALTLNFFIKKKYTDILKSIENKHQQKTSKFHATIINNIVDDYKNAAMGNSSEVNTQAIIERRFDVEYRSFTVVERFIKNAVGLLIILGLLGTFLGLTISIGKLIDTLGGIGSSGAAFEDSTNGIVAGLITAVSGMGIAFTTSLFAIGTAILMNIINILFNVESLKENVMVHIEEYLDNTISLLTSKVKDTQFVMMNSILRKTFVEFGDKIEKTLQNTVESLADKLTNVVMDVHLSSKELDNTVDKFDNALSNFSSNMKDFAGFNANLRTNIERMDVSFADATQAIIKTTENISSNYRGLEEFSSSVEKSTMEINSYSQTVIENISNLINEVKVSIESLRELGNIIKGDSQNKSMEMDEYKNKFEELMVSVKYSLTVIANETSESFSKSLSETSIVAAGKLSDDVKMVLKEIINIFENFYENEKMLAKTISLLPNQTIVYNETAVNQIIARLDDLSTKIER